MQARVLQIGRDELLLQTRAAILRHAGFIVESCFVTNRPDSAHFCLERYFDHAKPDTNTSKFHAVLLCHTLDQDRATAVAAEARREEPDIKVIVLEALDGPRLPPNLYDVSVSCKNGPATMVDMVRALFADDQQLAGAAPKTSPFPTDRAGAPRPELVHARLRQPEK